MPATNQSLPANFTKKILLALLSGAIFGLVLKYLPIPEEYSSKLIDGVLQPGGMIFIDFLKMLVIPVVFVSLVCGISSLGNLALLGRIGIRTFVLYIATTMLALTFGLCMAVFFKVGARAKVQPLTTAIDLTPPSIKESLLDMVPSNPIEAMASGNMMQIIIFAMFVGMAIMLAGDEGKSIRRLFVHLNAVITKLVYIVMLMAPYGIFLLLSGLFARQGLDVLIALFEYCVIVIIVLLLHFFVSYSILLKVLGRLNPILFFKKMYTAIFFAFGVSSSSASIPVVLDVVENKLGVNNQVASFVIPLGATINMDGTAIMQSIATVFIANAYQIDIGLSGYLTVMLMATLASIGTAGVPSVGLITLAMVLEQVGLPVEGIALIVGIDRILDMVRTAVNITGDAMVACIVATREKLIDLDVYNSYSDKF